MGNLYCFPGHMGTVGPDRHSERLGSVKPEKLHQRHGKACPGQIRAHLSKYPIHRCGGVRGGWHNRPGLPRSPCSYHTSIPRLFFVLKRGSPGSSCRVIEGLFLRSGEQGSERPGQIFLFRDHDRRLFKHQVDPLMVPGDPEVGPERYHSFAKSISVSHLPGCP